MYRRSPLHILFHTEIRRGALIKQGPILDLTTNPAIALPPRKRHQEGDMESGAKERKDKRRESKKQGMNWKQNRKQKRNKPPKKEGQEGRPDREARPASKLSRARLPIEIETDTERKGISSPSPKAPTNDEIKRRNPLVLTDPQRPRHAQQAQKQETENKREAQDGKKEYTQAQAQAPTPKAGTVETLPQPLPSTPPLPVPPRRRKRHKERRKPRTLHADLVGWELCGELERKKTVGYAQKRKECDILVKPGRKKKGEVIRPEQNGKRKVRDRPQKKKGKPRVFERPRKRTEREERLHSRNPNQSREAQERESRERQKPKKARHKDKLNPKGKF
ncbi:hypothetical protein B0H12DRAFT_1081477 [Mycena haematopus]|nr:hypothetical protein B0H12DRAFT_1081477 [Mycena haematopus]